MKKTAWLAVMVMILAAGASSGAVLIQETFDTGPEGWNIDKAADWEPNHQAQAWDTVGRRLMELAYTCPTKLAPFVNTDPLETALEKGAIDAMNRNK